MSQGGSSKKVSNSLVALSSAAILAVYTAGYTRTRAAADRFAAQTAGRSRPPAIVVSQEAARLPAPVVVSLPVPEAAAAPPAAAAPQPSVAKPEPKPAPVPVAAPVVKPAPTPAPVVAEPKVAPAPESKPYPAPAPKVEPKPEVAAVAPAAPPAPAVPATPPPPVWKDGTYTGWGTSRHGDIQAAVVIEQGKIASATIAQCLTRYSCSVISQLPPQVSKRQSPEVDFVSGATQSADAFYYAVVEALKKAATP